MRGLRAWTRDHDPHVRAAVELLIGHSDSMWLRRPDFVADYVTEGREATVDFRALADALADGRGPGASSTEVGVLRLAADIGTDRWRLSRLGEDATWRAMAAFVQASGWDQPRGDGSSLTPAMRDGLLDTIARMPDE